MGTGIKDRTDPEPVGITAERLAFLLGEIVRADADYHDRYSLILAAMTIADALGLRTGYRIDPNEPEWPVAYILLPAGQISWHMPQFSDEWDGHSVETKHRRIRKYCQATLKAQREKESDAHPKRP